MSYDLMFQKALDLQNAGALNEAESLYLRLLEVMPENSDVWNLLGLIAQSKGDDLKAVDCFLTAIKYAPRPFFAHFFNLGLAYKALNRAAEALEALEKAALLAPQTKEVWNYLGVLQAETGAVKEAVRSFCKALEVDGEYTDARVNLCIYTKDLETLVKLADEDDTNFLANLKAAEIVTERHKKEHYLKRAVAVSPERSDGLLAMAEFYRSSESFKDSLTFYHKVLNLDENNVSALLGAADIYLAMKDYEKAEKYYQKSFRQTREIAGAHLNYGVLLYQTGRVSEALEEYRRAADIAPDKAEISYNLALILKENGDFEEALGLMFNAHIKEPENQLFMVNIAETLALLYRQNAELALKIAENWYKQEPENIFSARLLAGMSGGVAAEIANTDYSKLLFDLFAENYDVTMERLETQIIHKFKEINGDIKGNVLELGCGTGRAVDLLKNDENVFDGVDVSEKMLEKAREKGKYRQLYQEDIIDFLTKNPPVLSYDVVLAFDVFCYLGNLEEIFAMLKGCKVWFSVESADEDRGQDYYLTPTGRYKHKVSALKKVLSKLGFLKIDCHQFVLRKEYGEDVWGVLFAVE